MIRKLAISAFCVTNVVAVLVMNQPDATSMAKERFLRDHVDPGTAYHVRYVEWLVKRYAHLAGLDNRWTMFSTVHRFDWWYVVKAIRSAGPEVLPLPLQSDRSFVERHFVDHKEAKIALNMYGNPDWRRAYGSYLCRQLAAAHDPAGFVVFELHYRMFLDREQARATGVHSEPTDHAQVVDAVMCPASAQGGAA